MKRFFRILTAAALLLGLLLPAASAEEDMAFVLSATDAEAAGDLITVTGTVYHAPPCSSFRVVFTYDDTVLEVVSGKKKDAKGIFMLNEKYEYEGKPAVSVISADVNAALEGEMDLFEVTFKVKFVPDSGKALFPVALTEFVGSAADLPQVKAIVNGCVAKIGASAQSGETDPALPPEEDPVEENDPQGETQGDPVEDPVDAPDGGSGNGTGTPPDETKTDGETDTAEKSTEPTGTWLLDSNSRIAYHVEDDGKTTTQYTLEFKTEEGRIVEAELFDEKGEPAGRLEIEQRPSGSLSVTAEELTAPETAPDLKWVWIAAAALALAIAAAVITLIAKKRGKEAAK